MSKPTDQIFITQFELDKAILKALDRGYQLGLKFSERLIKDGISRHITEDQYLMELKKIIKSIS